MNLDFNHLEVVFSQHKDGIKAVSPMFPGCRGIGPTEQEALVKLTQSVSRMMAKLTRTSLESILLSENYTDVLSGPSKSSDIKKRLFAMNGQMDVDPGQKKPQFVFMIKSLHELPDTVPTKQVPAIQDAGFQALEIDSGEETVLSAEIMPQSLSGPDGFSFGFPISLN